jgi:hypothetical protein
MSSLNKYILNFNVHPQAMFVFWILAKGVSLKAVHPQKICQYAKFYGLALTGANVACTLVV